MAWNYERNEDTALPIGDYRVKIKKAEKKVSSNGRDMLSFELVVNGSNRLIFHNIVFLEDKPEITNRALTQFFDSFAGIPDGEFDTAKWIGKIGAVHTKHEEYNGEKRARVHYFINANKQGNLPAWKEPEKKADSDSAAVASGGNDFVAAVEDVDDDSKLPF